MIYGTNGILIIFLNIFFTARFDENRVIWSKMEHFVEKMEQNGPFWVQNSPFSAKSRSFLAKNGHFSVWNHHLICQNWFDLNPYIVSGGAWEQTTSIFKTLKVSFSDLILVWVAILVQRWAGLSKQEIMYKQAWENGKYKE